MGPQAHAGLQLRCTSSGAPLALEPRPRRAIASPLRLRIARGGDAGAGPSVDLGFFFEISDDWDLERGWPPRPSRSPATPPEAPRDLLTHTRTRHRAPGARARPPGAPVRFRTGLDWSGLWQVSASYFPQLPRSPPVPPPNSPVPPPFPPNSPVTRQARGFQQGQSNINTKRAESCACMRPVLRTKQ